MIVCSICKEMVWSTIDKDTMGHKVVAAINAHYMTHSWLRRKLHSLRMMPKRWKLQRLHNREFYTKFIYRD
jgi:hypothetical protein